MWSPSRLYGKQGPFFITNTLTAPENCGKVLDLYVLLLVPSLFFLPAAAFVVRLP